MNTNHTPASTVAGDRLFLAEEIEKFAMLKKRLTTRLESCTAQSEEVKRLSVEFLNESSTTYTTLLYLYGALVEAEVQ